MVFFKVTSILFLLLLFVNGGDTKSYTVGDNGGWSFVVSSWPDNKTFYAGDELSIYWIFIYIYRSTVLLFKMAKPNLVLVCN